MSASRNVERVALVVLTTLALWDTWQIRRNTRVVDELVEKVAMTEAKLKMAGGGMRQAGFLAAAAHYALDHHVARLADDHARAQRLADGLRDLAGVQVQAPQTNIVFLDVPRDVAPGLIDRLARQGVLATGLYQLRLVTHLDVDDAGVDHAIAVLRRELG